MRCTAPARFAARRGTATVQMVFAFPLLLTITLGTIDFGQFAYTWLAVTNAARAGAAYASFNRYTVTTKTAWEDGIRQTVSDEMNNVPGFQPTQLTVTITPTTESDGLRRVKVQVSYPFSTAIGWPGLPQLAQLSHSVELRGIR